MIRSKALSILIDKNFGVDLYIINDLTVVITSVVLSCDDISQHFMPHTLPNMRTKSQYNYQFYNALGITDNMYESTAITVFKKYLALC